MGYPFKAITEIKGAKSNKGATEGAWGCSLKLTYYSDITEKKFWNLHWILWGSGGHSFFPLKGAFKKEHLGSAGLNRYFYFKIKNVYFSKATNTVGWREILSLNQALVLKSQRFLLILNRNR